MPTCAYCVTACILYIPASSVCIAVRRLLGKSGPDKNLRWAAGCTMIIRCRVPHCLDVSKDG